MFTAIAFIALFATVKAGGWSSKFSTDDAAKTQGEAHREYDHNDQFNKENAQGFTPLAMAIKDHNVGEVGRLLDNGADPNKRSQNITPVVGAIMQSFIGVDKTVQENIVRKLLTAGADANASSDGTPLIHAIKIGNVGLVRALLEHHAEAGKQPGGIPLNLAIGGGHLDMVPALIEAGADPEERDETYLKGNKVNAYDLAEGRGYNLKEVVTKHAPMTKVQSK